MVGVIRADHYMIVCSDPEQTGAFLRDVVGLTPNPEDPERFAAADGFEVHICPAIPFDPTVHTNNWMPDGLQPFADSFQSRATHLSFRVESLTDVLARIFEHGAKPFSLDLECAVEPIKSVTQELTFGSRSVYVVGPDNNLFEFVQLGVSLEASNLI